MDKLIITVTCDTTLSYWQNPNGPRPNDTKGVAEEYVRAVNAGASICHMHGSYTSDPAIQPDGRQLQIPIIEGWQDITERLYAGARERPLVQHGLASMRLEQKLQLWDLLKPDMSSINFNSHDEYFVPYSDDPPKPIYAVHPIPELREYARLAKQHGVKLEIECFGTGAYWAINYVRQGKFWNANKQPEYEPDLLADPLWLTIFLGWSGQGWIPPTSKALNYMVDHLPPRVNWNMSCMAPPSYWQIIAHAIAMGGHVRVGMEDCPYLEVRDQMLAKSNAELVEKAVRIAREVGREVASPDEARRIIYGEDAN